MNKETEEKLQQDNLEKITEKKLQQDNLEKETEKKIQQDILEKEAKDKEKQDTPYEKHMKKIDKTMLKFSSGAIAGYSGQYIGNVIVNTLQNRPNIFENRLSNVDYVAGIITGATGSVLSGKISTFQLVTLSTGIYYTVIRALNDYLCRPNISEEDFAARFLFDLSAVYFITQIRNTLLEDRRRRRGIIKREAYTFPEQLNQDFSTGLIITTYYAIRRYFREQNQNNNTTNNTSCNNAQNKNENCSKTQPT
jgi:hypothetical protein